MTGIVGYNLRTPLYSTDVVDNLDTSESRLPGSAKNDNILKELINRKSNQQLIFTAQTKGWIRCAYFYSNRDVVLEGNSDNTTDIYISRNYNYSNNETHKVTLLAIYRNSEFIKVYSKVNSKAITKIRQVVSKSKFNTYIDIFYDTTASNAIKFGLGDYFPGLWYQDPHDTRWKVYETPIFLVGDGIESDDEIYASLDL